MQPHSLAPVSGGCGRGPQAKTSERRAAINITNAFRLAILVGMHGS
jgi:hypothetical protein